MGHDCDDFSAELSAMLRTRYVVDRIDGRPILTGVSKCPYCEIRLRPDPTGVLELHDDRMRVIFRVSCMACGRTLRIVEDFRSVEIE